MTALGTLESSIAPKTDVSGNYESTPGRELLASLG
jgi:hypothetical protein